ncbi:MAG: hypothetical protein CSA75_04680, partial [Sorangium cellulosum]
EARTESRPSATLCSNPLAAGRLLQRANTAGRVVRAAQFQNLVTVEVTESRRSQYTLSIPRGQCRQVIAALGPGVSGVNLHALDASSDRIVANGYGANVASLNLCSKDTTLNAKVRLAVSVGAGKSVIGTLND